MTNSKESLALVFLVLSFFGILLVPSPFPPVNAFKALDQAMCKQIEFKTLTCGERTSGFLLTDDWTYFWFRADFEKSDDRAKAEITFRDPDGLSFAAMTGTVTSQALPLRDISPIMVAEMVIWMGIEVNEAYAQGGFVLSPSSVNPGEVKQSSANIWGKRAEASLLPSAYHYINITLGPAGPGRPEPPPPRGYDVWVAKTKQPANTKVGEWRAEFTLDAGVVVSERFTIGKTTTTAATPTTVTTPIVTGTRTEPSAAALPYNFVLAGGAVVAMIVVGVALFAWRRRAATKISPNTPERGSRQ